MSPIAELWDPLTPLVGWLATYAVHSTILLALVALVAPRLRSDAWRETLWRTALLGAFLTASFPAAVGFTPIVGKWTIGQAATRPLRVASEAPIESLRSGESPLRHRATQKGPISLGASTQSAATIENVAPEASAPSAEPPVGGDQGPAPAHLIRFIVAVWVLVAVVLLGRVGWRQVRLFRALRGRRSIREGPLREMLVELRRSAGVRRSVRLSASAVCPTPIALGWSEISVPERFVTDLEPDQQRSALAHELAHLVRRDPVWDLFTGIVEALFFFQPLNRIARHRLREAAENLSDDWAVRQTGSSLSLARCLTDITSWVGAGPEPLRASAMAMADGGSPLLRRVRRLAERDETEPNPSRLRFAGAAGLLALMAAAAPAISLIAPRAVAGQYMEEILDLAAPTMLATSESSPEDGAGTTPPDSATLPDTVIVHQTPSAPLAEQRRIPVNRVGEQKASANVRPQTVATANQAQQEAVGITYALSLGYGPGAVPGLSSTFAGEVAFAAGRGRVDVVEGAVAEGISSTDEGEPGRLAMAGDYYLFDSTGFILVRPATRTFSSYVFTDASISEELVPDTLPFARFDQGATADVVLTQHGPVDVYWHADNAGGRIIRGHLGISDTPLTELIVLAAIGATHAVANISESQGIPSEAVIVTAAAHFDGPGGPRSSTRLRSEGKPQFFVDGVPVPIAGGRGGDDDRLNVITSHMMWGLEIAAVDLSRLVLPDGFTETAWPGFEGRTDLPPLSADGGARWRTIPGVRR